MKTITILLPDLRSGGTEKMRLILAKQWANDYQVEFLLLSKEGELIDFVPVHIPIKTLNVKRYRQLLPSLLSYIKKEQPDILIAAMWPLSIIAALATRLSGKQTICVVSEHGILSSQYQLQGSLHSFMLRVSMGIGYRLSHKCIAVSNGVAKDMAYLSRLPLKYMNVIYNPASSGTKPTADSSTNPYSDVLVPVIIAVGRYKEVKNHDLLIRAFALLKNKIEAKLYIIGDGELAKDYLYLIKLLKLENDVVLTGFIPDPTPYYVHADLFTLSSNNEGFGNVIVEALECGLPIVSTDCQSGPREILENGKYGILVPVGDVNALAEAMINSLNKKHDVEALKRRASDFSVDKIAKQYLEVFR